MEFATDINNVMYAYIDRKEKIPCNTLLRAIGFDTDKDILKLFGIADEIQVNKRIIRKNIGKISCSCIKSWMEDFVDEDTGEVVSIERNEVILERDTYLDEDNIQLILDTGIKTIILQKDTDEDYSIIFNTLQKDTSNSEIEALKHIYRQLRGSIHQMTIPLVVL
jgi:DNA-directed RNA polymerase subunit beta